MRQESSQRTAIPKGHVVPESDAFVYSTDSLEKQQTSLLEKFLLHEVEEKIGIENFLGLDERLASRGKVEIYIHTDEELCD